MLHAERPDGSVAAAQKCAIHGPLSVATRGGGCTAWNSTIAAVFRSVSRFSARAPPAAAEPPSSVTTVRRRGLPRRAVRRREDGPGRERGPWPAPAPACRRRAGVAPPAHAPRSGRAAAAAPPCRRQPGRPHTFREAVESSGRPMEPVVHSGPITFLSGLAAGRYPGAEQNQAEMLDFLRSLGIRILPPDCRNRH